MVESDIYTEAHVLITRQLIADRAEPRAIDYNIQNHIDILAEEYVDEHDDALIIDMWSIPDHGRIVIK